MEMVLSWILKLRTWAEKHALEWLYTAALIMVYPILYPLCWKRRARRREMEMPRSTQADTRNIVTPLS